MKITDLNADALRTGTILIRLHTDVGMVGLGQFLSPRREAGLYARWRFRDMIELGNPDILQPDILNAGGPSEIKRIYDLALAYNKPVVPHSPNVGITSFASLHVYATMTNGTWAHEYSPELYDGDVQPVQDLFEERVLPTEGKITLSDNPGLGLTLNEKALKQAVAD